MPRWKEEEEREINIREELFESREKTRREKLRGLYGKRMGPKWAWRRKGEGEKEEERKNTTE